MVLPPYVLGEKIQAMTGIITTSDYFDYLMVAYVTGARFYLQWELNRGYVSWKVNILCLVPVHDWMH